MSARTTMMESSSNTLVYLHKNPRPIRTPVRGQCQVKQKQAGSGAKQWAEKAHPEFVRPKNHRAGADGESHSGAFAEISGRESLRPHPVMRLVELQIGRFQQCQTQAGNGEDKQPDRALDFHDAETGISRGWRAATSGSRGEMIFCQINSQMPRMSNVSPAARKKVATTSLGQCAPR